MFVETADENGAPGKVRVERGQGFWAIHTLHAQGAKERRAGHGIGLAQRGEEVGQALRGLGQGRTRRRLPGKVGERLVGTVEFSDYPPEAQKVRRVGGYSRVDLEAVAALKPDLVIGWQSGNAPATLDALRALGLTVYVSQPDRIEDVAREIERFGQLAGTEKIAQPKAAELRRRQAALQREYAGRPTVRVFYQIWKQPLATIGGKQIISSAIRLCGGENVFAALETLAPTVSVEAVIAANPEAIVASGMDAARPEWLDDWKRWPTIAAVARGNLFFVPPELIQRHTPRLLDGAEILCRQLESARERRPK